MTEEEKQKSRDSVQLEASHFREVQISKYQFVYTLNVSVANNVTLPAFLEIKQDADFRFERIMGAMLGPTNVNGIRQINASTDFPLAGTVVPSGAGLGAYADRGLMFKITDTGAGRELTDGFVDAVTMLSPGYGLSLGVALPFSYYALRNSKIRFDIRNRDSVADLYHTLTLTAIGTKYL